MAGKPHIGIIGDGNVGSNLQKGLSRAGYDVKTSGHEPEKVQKLAKDSDVLILAVPSTELKNVLDEFDGAHNGKVLVDVTNVVTGDFEYAGRLEQSKAEELQTWAKDAKVVKAFNTVFAPTMSEGQANGDRLSVFVAGDDERSREIVRTMAQDVGFDAVDAGPLKNARYLETLGYLNMTLGMKQNQGNVGFRLVRSGGNGGQRASR